jgi:hypothetical protein
MVVKPFEERLVILFALLISDEIDYFAVMLLRNTICSPEFSEVPSSFVQGKFAFS